mgnify:CR=1 FL=1
MITEGADGKIWYWEWDGSWKLIVTLADLRDEGWEKSKPVSRG